MKYFYLCLIPFVLSSPDLQKPLENNLKSLDFNQVMEIIGGFLVGMSTDVNAPDVAPCVKNSAEFGGSIEQAVKDFSKHTYDGIKDGFMDLSNAFAALPGFVETCVPASVETAKVIEKAVLAWAHPFSLIYHTGLNIIINGAEIFADISKAMGDAQTGNWYDFGFNIGQAAFKIIYIPKGELGTVEMDKKLFVEGLLSGLAVETSVDFDLIPDFQTEIEAGFKLMRKKNFHDAKSGLTYLANVYRNVAPGIQEKKDMLLKVAEVLTNPYSFVYVPEKKLIINGRALDNLVCVAGIDYRMLDWFNSGYYFGRVVRVLQ